MRKKKCYYWRNTFKRSAKIALNPATLRQDWSWIRPMEGLAKAPINIFTGIRNLKNLVTSRSDELQAGRTNEQYLVLLNVNSSSCWDTRKYRKAYSDDTSQGYTEAIAGTWPSSSPTSLFCTHKNGHTGPKLIGAHWRLQILWPQLLQGARFSV